MLSACSRPAVSSVARRLARTRLSNVRFSACTVFAQAESSTILAESAPKRTATRTRKRLKDLPSTRLDTNGAPIAPLPPWNGGLRDSKRPDNSHELNEPFSKSIVTKRTRRRARGAETKQDGPKSSDLTLPQTPLANEILGNLARFPHCILLTRVGQFYESYFDQATDVAKLLNIKLTTKAWGGGRVPMCGFPLMHLDKYLKVLVQQQQRLVAICEEFMRDPALGPKGGFDRRVTRIVTPGTLIDEPFLNPYENNYLLSIVHERGAAGATPSVGLAWIDVSTGDCFTQEVPVDALQDQLARINPREVVLDISLQEQTDHPVLRALSEDDFLISYASPSSSATQSPLVRAEADDDDDVTSLLHRGNVPTKALTGVEAHAMQLLMTYMRNNLLEHMPSSLAPRQEAATSRMQIDAHTIKALEIRETMAEGGTAGSLLSVIKRTVTTSGTRLLARWLCSPSTSLSEINARQSLVSFFKSRPHLRADVVHNLRELEDVTRIVQKFLLNRGDLDDLVAVRQTITTWKSIRSRLELEEAMELQERGTLQDQDWDSLETLLSHVSSFEELADRITNSLSRRTDTAEGTNEDDVGSIPSSLQSGAREWSISPHFSTTLQSLHQRVSDLLHERDQLERDLQTQYNAPSLSLRTSPQQSFHVHIARGKRDSSKLTSDISRFTLLSESASTCSFLCQDWSVLGTKILDASKGIQAAEREAFEILRTEVNFHADALRRTSRVVDELDVTLAFANIAEDLNFTRPLMREDSYYHIEGGRHPTVELGLLGSGRIFTTNTVSLTTDGPLHVITGPNMAGKSTLLRQTALIAILAQTGSFVPADSAELGIVDRVFSRIGAKDDLFHDRSTFMVEMLETADILRRATPRSLVIMDEVGRGTTVTDGVSIAFATIHHLLTVNQCRAMFATHFHELADMLGYSEDHRGQGAFAKVRFYCTDVDETPDGFFSYSHRLKPGVNRDSHGLKVAQLAGMPLAAMEVASTAVSRFKQRTLSESDRARLRDLGQSLTPKSS